MMFSIRRNKPFDGKSSAKDSLFGRLVKRVKGFSLIEVMAASTIMTFSITGTLSLATHSYKVLNGVRDFSRANQILQQKMEDIRMLSYTQVTALPSTFTDPKDPQGKFSGTISQTAYRYDNSGNVVTRTVTLRVTWMGQNNKTRSLTMTTLFTSGGLNLYIF